MRGGQNCDLPLSAKDLSVAIAIRLATLPDYGPTGGLFDDTGLVPW
jgi:hypothetical protein